MAAVREGKKGRVREGKKGCGNTPSGFSLDAKTCGSKVGGLRVLATPPPPRMSVKHFGVKPRRVTSEL